MARDHARKRRAAAFAPGTKLVQSRFEVPSSEHQRKTVN